LEEDVERRRKEETNGNLAKLSSQREVIKEIKTAQAGEGVLEGNPCGVKPAKKKLGKTCFQ